MAAKVSSRPAAEGAAGGGEHEAPHLAPARGRRGTGGARSARCRWAGCAPPRRPGLRGHQLPRHDQGLLVGEGHVLPRLERAVRGHEAHRAHRRRHHQVRSRRGSPTATIPSSPHAHLHGGEVHEPARASRGGGVGHGDDPRTVAGDLLRPGAPRSCPRPGRRPGSDREKRPPRGARSCPRSRWSRGWRDLSWTFMDLEQPGPGGAVHAQRTESNSKGRARRTANCRAGRACPRGRGRARPESLTPAQRLSRLSSRSPRIPSGGDEDPQADRVRRAGRSGMPEGAHGQGAQRRRPRGRPSAPSTVLFGETCGGEPAAAPGVADEEGHRVRGHDDGEQEGEAPGALPGRG